MHLNSASLCVGLSQFELEYVYVPRSQSFAKQNPPSGLSDRKELVEDLYVQAATP
jgi:hypothetical protein